MSKYQLIECPNCGKREAFVYLDDVTKALQYNRDTVRVICNRRNHCGFEGTVKIEQVDGDFTSVEQVQKRVVKIDKEKAMHPRGIMAIDLISKGTEDFPFEKYRGIDKEIFEKTNCSYYKEGWLSKITSDIVTLGNGFVKILPGDFGKFYLKNSFKRRNLMFWVSDYEGEVRRVLLRSTLSGVYPKEMQVVVPSADENKNKGDKYTIWNIESVVNNPEVDTILAIEGVYDAMSLLQALKLHNNVAAVSLAGVAQIAKLNELIELANRKRVEKYGSGVKEVKLYIMFDQDVTGNKYAEAMMKLYPNSERITPKGTNKDGSDMDFNDMLMDNEENLTNYLKSKIKEL